MWKVCQLKTELDFCLCFFSLLLLLSQVNAEYICWFPCIIFNGYRLISVVLTAWYFAQKRDTCMKLWTQSSFYLITSNWRNRILEKNNDHSNSLVDLNISDRKLLLKKLLLTKKSFLLIKIIFIKLLIQFM